MTLIERIEAGETGREIDAQIWEALGNPVDRTGPLGPFREDGTSVPRYTTSLDAVMALKYEVLPGWQVYHANETVNIEGPMWSVGVTNRMGSDRLGFGTSMAAALLCAILKAKEANNG